MLSVLMTYIRTFAPKSEKGQDLIEYAMLGGLIALGILAVGLLAISGAIEDMFDGIGGCIDFTAGGCTPF